MADTRQQILKEAEKLYRMGGYDKISLQTVANSLHISKPALFHHFKNKQLLFFEMLKAMLEHLNLVITTTIAQSGTSVQGRLQGLMQRMTLEPHFDVMRLLREDFAIMDTPQQLIINQMWYERMHSVIQNIFKEAVARKELKPHDTALATDMFIHSWDLLPRPGSFLATHINREGVTPIEYIEKMLNMFLNGLKAH